MRPHQRIVVIQFRPRQQIQARRVDEHHGRPLLDHRIILSALPIQVELVLKPAAPPCQYGHAQSAAPVGLGDFSDAGGGARGHAEGWSVHPFNIGSLPPRLKGDHAGGIAHAMTARAIWATNPLTSRGRLHAEPESLTRSPYQRDRDRVIHSSAFRKLQYKTQVFVNHEGDFFRTRLTHSIEVAQIARSVARELGLDEDLTEALALAHDLGHTPFGHAGEDALHAAMKPFGGFDHNAQALRIVTLLESRYAAFDGLNLTWETLEGLAKHNGPLHRPPPYVAEYDAMHRLDLHGHASAEAQVAALADDIAYHSHDLDDGLRAGLFNLDDIGHLPVVKEALAEAKRASLDMPEARLRHETNRRVINALVTDLVRETRSRIAALAPRHVDDIRNAETPVVAFSPAMAEANRVIKEFLFRRMYRHWKVNRMTGKARRVTSEIFTLLHANPGLLPDHWRGRSGDTPGTPRAAAAIADYIAGMTDRFARDEHLRLTDLSVPG